MRRESGAERWLRWVTVGLSGFFVLVFVYTAMRRLHYPFEVDRVESGMMTSVWRLRHGYPLYVEPSMEWASFLYAPLFFYLAAGLSKVMGLSYAPLRMVSLLSTLGSFAVIYTMVWKETRRWAAAAVAVGVFASMYGIVLAWFDVARVDSLSVFLFLLAVLATRRMHPVVAAVMWLLAFHGKQTFLPLGLAIFLVEWQRPKRMLTGMVTFAALAWGSVLWLNHATHHWYSYYAFGTSGSLGWAARPAAMFLPYDLLNPLPVVITLIGAAAVLTPMKWRERDGSFFAIVTVLVGGAIWFVRAHAGANINATIPLYAWIAVLAGVSVHRLMEHWEKASEKVAEWGPMVLWLALALQLTGHLYRPGEFLPTAGQLAARERFLAALKATPGDVWVVNHSYDGLLAGKPMHPEMDAFDAVLGRGYGPAQREFTSMMEAHEFRAVVLDRQPESYAPQGTFTSPPFGPAYSAKAVAVGAEGGMAADEPAWTMLPCHLEVADMVPGTLAAGAVMVDRSGCAAGR